MAILAVAGGAVFMLLGVRYPRFTQPALRQGLFADFIHALVNSLLLDIPLAISLSAVSCWIERSLGVRYLELLSHQSLWLQTMAFLMGGDLVKWTIHMLHHRVPVLWRFHRLHHCTRQMDAISLVRTHPVEVYLNRVVFLTLMMVVAGIDKRIVVLYSAADLLQGLWVHSNTHLHLGWLNYIFATQEFHHWHHANTPEAFNKNYGGFFSVWDWVFGTAYCPKGRAVPGFGIPEVKLPPTRYRDHLLTPFLSDVPRSNSDPHPQET